jgi:predicted NBD/HSP70 family sugar kinase
MRYVGVDIGKWKCRAAVMDPEGSIVEEFTFPNDAEGILSLASRLTSSSSRSSNHTTTGKSRRPPP